MSTWDPIDGSDSHRFESYFFGALRLGSNLGKLKLRVGTHLVRVRFADFDTNSETVIFEMGEKTYNGLFEHS